MKKILLPIAGFLFLSFLILFVTVNKFFIHKSPLITNTPTTTRNVLATSTTTKKTYVSKEDGYTVTYPGTWIPDLLPPLDSSGSGEPIFSTGPVGNKILGYPSFIKIIVSDNTQNLSFTDYIKQHFASSTTFSPITLADKTGKEATNNQGTIPTEIVMFENKNKMYEIVWYQGSQPKITQQQFKQFLVNMKFT